MTRSIDVLCAGIVVADHVCAPISHVPTGGELVLADDMILTIGGCAANAAVDLAKMGVTPSVAGRVGADHFGRIVRGMLEEQRVDTSALKESATRPTSQTMIINVQGQDRRFVHIFGANAEFSAADIPLDLARRCKVLYLGGYLVMPGLQPEELARSFATLRAAGVKIVVDVACPGKADYLSRLEKLLPVVDVFLPNNTEAELILGEADPVRQAEAFRKMGAGTVVITLGGEGAVLVDGRQRLRSGVYPTEYVDGSGGGDAFDAGYIYGLLRGMDAEGCLKVASALGASCVRAIGTTPGVFTEPECREFIRKHTLRIERV